MMPTMTEDSEQSKKQAITQVMTHDTTKSTSQQAVS